MPGFTTHVEHEHSQDVAVARLRAFAEQAMAKYGEMVSQAEGNWRENELIFFVVAMGLRVEGRLVVEERLATVSMQYPFTASLFAGRMEAAIREQLREALD